MANPNPGFKLVKSESVPLTRELVDNFTKLEASPTERPFNETREKHLSKKLEAGLWVSTHWAKARLGSKEYRMNGQHSSIVLQKANGTFPEGQYAHVDTYQVDDEPALAVLFRQFDDRKSGRSSGDVANAWQQLYEPIKDVKPEIAKLGIEAIVWYAKYVEGAAVKNGDDIYDAFGNSDHYEYLRWLGDVFSVKTPEMKRVGVVAAMHRTFEANATEARTFWAQVAKGGLDFEDHAPSTVLDNWLKKAVSAEVRRDLQLKDGHFYQAAIFAWNAFRENKTVKDVKSDTRKGFHNVVE